MSAQRTALDQNRWHFNHGPIDIVAEAHGDPYAVAAAHDAAWARFVHVLDELVHELPLLRLPVTDKMRPRNVVARRMWDACAAFSPMFITPMAAVAGSVAQELIAFYERPGIERAWINNGGDIALHLAPGQSASTGAIMSMVAAASSPPTASSSCAPTSPCAASPPAGGADAAFRWASPTA
jgi:ApbE superfamily uncharacterized protein (UPF0280 family)